MLRFLIDEDIPRSTGKMLKDRGYEILDVRDYGLRGKEDEDIFDFAQKEKCIIFTADKGFGNPYRFPGRNHRGIVIAHFPDEITTSEINSQISIAIKNLSEDDFSGNLIIIEPGKIRIRNR